VDDGKKGWCPVSHRNGATEAVILRITAPSPRRDAGGELEDALREEVLNELTARYEEVFEDGD